MEGERNYRALFDQSAVGVAQIDSHTGRFVLINQSYCDLLGYTRGEMLQRDFQSVTHPDDLRADLDNMERLRTGTLSTFQMDKRYLRKDGAEVWVRLTVVPLWAPGASPDFHLAIVENVTDRKHAEEALRYSEERWRLAAGLMGLATWDFYPLTGEFRGDEKLREMCWMTADEPVTFASLERPIQSSDRGRVKETFERSLDQAGDARYPIEFRIEGPEGAKRDVLCNARAFFEGGRAVRVLGTALDITERKRAEAAVRQSEKLLSFSLATARTGVWELDLVDHSAHRSLLHDQIFGYQEPLPRWTYEMFIEHVIPEDREEVDRRFRHAVATGTDWSFECRIVRRDGERRWIWAAGRHHPNDGDPPRKLAGIVQDITERKLAEQALRDSEERFRTMANAIPQLAWVAQPGGYISWFNQRWYEYTGTTPEQMAGWGWQSVHDPVTLPKVLEAWRRSLATGEPFDMVFPLRGADGVFRPFLTRVLPLKGSDGQVIQWFGTNTDVTERMHVEDELKRARQVLEDADRGKNEFLAMLSHELRNPLEPIRNSLFILDHAVPGGEQARRAQRVIDRQVTQLTRLVDDLLDVTRISRGKVQLQLESLDFTEVVSRAVDDRREVFTKRGLDLQLSLPDERLQIRGDRTRVAQVMGNLLGNAAKFTERGGKVTVTVEADKQLRQAVARVRDTGPGITPAMLPGIFDMFTQADTTLDRSKGGLGLGLALARSIMEIHGGSVSAESEGLGKGATFTVRFPLEAGLPTTTERVRGSVPRHRHHRVLVIEDNVDAAETLREALELSEATVEVAFSGPEGLERAHAFHPEVVLCDIGLPGMDGYEVARAMRAEPELKSAALVALTGYAGPEDIERSRRAGFDHLLAKPASMAKLEQILASLP